MRTLAAAAALLAMTLPSGGSALSCSMSDLANAVQEAVEAPEPYAILVGTLIPTGAEVQVGGPPADEPVDHNSPELPEPMVFTISARFEGQRLGILGFRQTEPVNVQMDRICNYAISDCESFDRMTNREGLLIARITPNGYQVQVQTCGSNFYPDPTGRDLRIASDCVFGRDCPVREENR